MGPHQLQRVFVCALKCGWVAGVGVFAAPRFTHTGVEPKRFDPSHPTPIRKVPNVSTHGPRCNRHTAGRCSRTSRRHVVSDGDEPAAGRDSGGHDGRDDGAFSLLDGRLVPHSGQRLGSDGPGRERLVAKTCGSHGASHSIHEGIGGC